MPDLVLDSDPRTTRVRAEWRVGTPSEAGIYERDGGYLNGWHKANGVKLLCRWDMDGDRCDGNGQWPKLINAPPEPEEMETVEVERYGVVSVKDAEIVNSFSTMEFAERSRENYGSAFKVLTLRGSYQRPKPKPPEPVVLEGKIIDGYWEEKSCLKICLDERPKERGLLGRKCTLTIQPEGK